MRNGKGSKEELVGRIGVDAGMVMVGDPCYHLHQTEAELQSSGFAGDFEGFVELLEKGKNQDAVPVGIMEHANCACAIVINGFGGDGIFPVYIKRNEDGDVSELIVRFER